MPDQLVTRLELGRLPFRRRPVAEPGTTIVLQMADGTLLAPQYPFTTGETFMRGPKAAYAVDITSHGGEFECELPSSSHVVSFSARVQYSWVVSDPAQLVATAVHDPFAVCRSALERWLRPLTSQVPPSSPTDAERLVSRQSARGPLNLECGLRVQDIAAWLKMDVVQAGLTREWEIGVLSQRNAERDAHHRGRVSAIDQANDLQRQAERERHYGRAVAGGRADVMAVVMAQDRSKGPEILNTMISLSEREQQRALDAIKVIIDGGEIRIGELDEAVQAAVQSMIGILRISTPVIESPTEPGHAALPGSGEPT